MQNAMPSDRAMAMVGAAVVNFAHGQGGGRGREGEAPANRSVDRLAGWAAIFAANRFGVDSFGVDSFAEERTGREAMQGAVAPMPRPSADPLASMAPDGPLAAALAAFSEAASGDAAGPETALPPAGTREARRETAGAADAAAEMPELPREEDEAAEGAELRWPAAVPFIAVPPVAAPVMAQAVERAVAQAVAGADATAATTAAEAGPRTRPAGPFAEQGPGLAPPFGPPPTASVPGPSPGARDMPVAEAGWPEEPGEPVPRNGGAEARAAGLTIVPPGAAEREVPERPAPAPAFPVAARTAAVEMPAAVEVPVEAAISGNAPDPAATVRPPQMPAAWMAARMPGAKALPSPPETTAQPVSAPLPGPAAPAPEAGPGEVPPSAGQRALASPPAPVPGGHGAAPEAPRPAAAGKTIVRETAMGEMAVRQTAVQEMAVRQMAVQEMAVQETAESRRGDTAASTPEAASIARETSGLRRADAVPVMPAQGMAPAPAPPSGAVSAMAPLSGAILASADADPAPPEPAPVPFALPDMPAFRAGTPALQAPPATLRHVTARIAQLSRPLPNGPMELILNPEELGRLKLSFTGTETGLHVTVAADRPETLDLMRRHIDLLAQEMRRLGHEAVQFSFGGGGAGAGGREPAPQRGPVTGILFGGDAAAPASARASVRGSGPAIRLGGAGLDLRL